MRRVGASVVAESPDSRDARIMRSLAQGVRTPLPSPSAAQWITSVLLHGKLHITLCALAALWCWSSLIGAAIYFRHVAVAAGMTISIYQWNRLTDWREDSVNCRNELSSAQRHSVVIRVVCLLFVGLCGVVSLLEPSRNASGVVVAILVLGVLYSSPIPGIGRLKRLHVAKNVVPAFGWALLTVAYPAFAAGQSFSTPVCVAMLYMFGSVAMVELIWDIRDVEGDRSAGIMSVAVVRGAAATKNYVRVLNLGCALLVVLAWSLERVPVIWMGLLAHNVFIALWLRLAVSGTTMGRMQSHLLVAFQTLLLFGQGVLARWAA